MSPKGLTLKLMLAAGLLALLLGGVVWDWGSQQTLPPVASGGEPPVEAALPAGLSPAPDVTFTALNGRVISRWTDFPEEKVLVHFWASWCPQCVVEMPHIMAYAKAHVGKAAVVMVSIDDTEPAMQKAMKGYADAPVLWVWDKNRTLSLKTFQTVNVPETVVLDAQRRMVDKWVGAHPWQ